MVPLQQLRVLNWLAESSLCDLYPVLDTLVLFSGGASFLAAGLSVEEKESLAAAAGRYPSTLLQTLLGGPGSNLLVKAAQLPAASWLLYKVTAYYARFRAKRVQASNFENSA